MKRLRVVRPVGLWLIVCALLLGISAPAISKGHEPEMSQQQAGDEYLSIVCASNAATKLFNKRVYQGDPLIIWDDLRDRLPEIQHASGALSRARAHAARDLLNPPAPWPSGAEDNVRRMINLYLRESHLHARAAWAPGVPLWNRLDRRARNVAREQVRVSTDIRDELSLPAPGRGC